MKLKTWATFFFYFLFLSQLVDLQAQKKELACVISWEPNLIFFDSEQNPKEFLYFKKAIYSDPEVTLPRFYNKVPVDFFYQDYEITVHNLQTLPLTVQEVQLLPKNYDVSSFQVEVVSFYEKKKSFASVRFIPIFKQNGQFVKVLSAEITLEGKNPEVKSKSGYASNSILRMGEWYKIAVEKTGLHKVTYSDLQNLGIQVANLNPEHISLFGNGGGMLPEANKISRYDDLNEIPVQIHCTNGATFKDGDYFVFYAQGPHTWTFDTNVSKFSHTYNVYSDQAYYFINVNAGIGEKKRIELVDNTSLTANHQVQTYTHYDFFEEDKINLVESGRKWFGDRFDITRSYTYSFTIPSIISEKGKIRTSVAFASPVSSSVSVSVNGKSSGKVFGGSSGDAIAGLPILADLDFTTATSPLSVVLEYDKPSSSSIAYLNWIEIEAVCRLEMHSSQFPFCNPSTRTKNAVTQFNIQGSDTKTTVWDVTEQTHPFQLKGELQNGTFSFKSPTEKLRKFVAFNGNSFYSVSTVGKIDNQNLHGDTEIDYVIVSHPDFISEAQRLADYRRNQDGFKVKVVTPAQIYNEFSSGAQDPTAIRDYMKMLYEKSAAVYPRYLLLFGRPSFDYRGRVSGTKLFVPNYQTDTNFSKDNFRANDDYFGLLDDNEGYNSVGITVDISIGRFPVLDLSGAKIAVDKTINYSEKRNLVTDPNSTQISNFGDWRNVIALVADDEDINQHIYTADASAQIVAQNNKNINLDKIYCDAYPQASYAGGQRYPDVSKAISERMRRGAFLFSYVGHGGGNGWSHERILETTDIPSWTNKYNQPVMTTLTCEFAWYDRPTTSPGELVFLNPNGGAAGMITTSRTAYQHPNHDYSLNLYETLFVQENGQYKRLGDLNRVAKNESGGAKDSYNMIVTFGDPAMPLAIPVHRVVTDSMNRSSAANVTDTLKALSKVSIKGAVTDQDGNILHDFNGNLYPSIFDKEKTYSTLVNDPRSAPFDFQQQKNILFRGNTTVKNGKFEFSFIIPKDIDFAYGNGKISYYARSATTDATGYFDQFIIGGISDNVYNDSIGPQMEVYLNDETFVNGSIVEPNPILLVYLTDELGINTSGNGIGHDLVAILDDETNSPFLLNEYYETDLDSYNSGKVRYPLKNLSIGKHQLKVRAWDIVNNLSEKTISFEVISDKKLALAHVLNYPNPFTTHTDFYFEHNQSGGQFDIIVQIFTVSGKIVKTITSQQTLQGNRSYPVSWDGLDDFGDKLAKGVYVYRLKVRNQQGDIVEKIEKLVIL
jgi:hypothetical protein